MTENGRTRWMRKRDDCPLPECSYPSIHRYVPSKAVIDRFRLLYADSLHSPDRQQITTEITAGKHLFHFGQTTFREVHADGPADDDLFNY